MYWEEMEKAMIMLRNLPREDAMAEYEPFYNNVWKFYLQNMELMENFRNILLNEDAFLRCLHCCREQGYEELFAVALALYRKRLDREILSE